MPQQKVSASHPKNPALILAIDHYSVIVANTAKALEFYQGILNLQVDASRPDLGYPGAWLLLGSSQLHLLELPNPDSAENRPEHGGRDRHVALQVSNLETIMQRLDHSAIAYSKSKSGRTALFCRDFDGNAIELVEKQVSS